MTRKRAVTDEERALFEQGFKEARPLADPTSASKPARTAKSHELTRASTGVRQSG